MTTIICEPCYDCKYTDCVAVCPVECFWQDEKMLYIDPNVCVDCEACIPECPVGAIWWETRNYPVPASWRSYIQLNREKSAALKSARTGHITSKAAPREGPDCKKAANA
jgi:ferredoxin